MSVETVDYILQIQTEQAIRDLEKVERVTMRIMSLLRRMGLPEQVRDAIALLQTLITTAHALRLALIALQTASGPYGWVMALTSLGISAVSTAVVAQDIGRRAYEW